MIRVDAPSAGRRCPGAGLTEGKRSTYPERLRTGALSLAQESVRSYGFARDRAATEGVRSHVAEVRVQENESIESALRRFKRKVQQEDIIKDIKKHSFYLKPGDKRRAKQALARKRSRKKMRRDAD